jgi:ABC-type dipeptide/oligopeptide/nickel transport system ATPase component
MRQIRGNEIGMIFQDPMTSLNPTMTIGDQIAETVILHRGADKKTALARAVEVLGLVGMPHPAERVGNYPHQLSGGMRQGVMIAMALACEPRLLIADEPTTALDVTIQKQILELIDDLRRRLGMAVILVTHDLGVIAGRADRATVMYAGKVVETTTTQRLFANPRHPYTQPCSAHYPITLSTARSGCTASLACHLTSLNRRPHADSRRGAVMPRTPAAKASRRWMAAAPIISTAVSSRASSQLRQRPASYSRKPAWRSAPASSARPSL